MFFLTFVLFCNSNAISIPEAERRVCSFCTIHNSAGCGLCWGDISISIYQSNAVLFVVFDTITYIFETFCLKFQDLAHRLIVNYLLCVKLFVEKLEIRMILARGFCKIAANYCWWLHSFNEDADPACLNDNEQYDKYQYQFKWRIHQSYWRFKDL